MNYFVDVASHELPDKQDSFKVALPNLEDGRQHLLSSANNTILAGNKGNWSQYMCKDECLGKAVLKHDDRAVRNFAA